MLYTLAATLADGLEDRFFAEGPDHRLIPPVAEIDGSHAHDLIASAHTSAAEDAFVRFKIKGRVGSVRRSFQSALPESFNRFLIDPNISGHSQKFTILTLLTEETLIRMIDDGQFHDHSPDLLYLFCLRADLHSVLGGCGAGGWQSPHAFNLDDT